MCATRNQLIKFIFFIALISQTRSALVYPGHHAGIFVAIAVPIDIPNQHAFLSYNFEANYGVPRTWHATPTKNDEIDTVADELIEDVLLAKDCNNCTQNIEETKTEDENEDKDEATEDKNVKKRIERSLLSRTTFYEILRHKLKENGFIGEPCLLRLICETNATQLGDINGVLGNLIHIIFSPSSSRYEALPKKYYKAEWHGKTRNDCLQYAQKCPHNVLDFISKPLTQFVANLLKQKIYY